MRLYRVIYQAIEDVEAAMKGMLDPVYEEQVTGHAVVRQTFKHPESAPSLVPMCLTVRSPAEAKPASRETESRSSRDRLHP